MMTEALNLHNAVIRKTRWTTFGYIIEQEGDSFTLCFYEALDAVTFALMVGRGRGRGVPLMTGDGTVTERGTGVSRLRSVWVGR